ncbi:IS110 family transposase [Chondrinema litorale]|uniref:IS110 family transposase n=1 Tax=Chondrinema litorale TaxID=2994555 RepID=UPI002543C8EE|nr:IS110 family transposase [Chondrinema litorale]UZR97115.1 IS110 family transposase [Chondrinema litorale]
MAKISLDIINPNAAGIDIGSKSHFVSIGQDTGDVREFGVYTKDHQEMIKWLRENGVSTIAMESTGTYWQTLFNALQFEGFEVLLVNGRDIKNVKGKKTDVIDCMWIQQLHSLGLLSGSFLPDECTRQLQTYYNHRQGFIRHRAKYTQKMQKALRLMNIRLDIAIRDITGKTGLAIIEAILQGERDPIVLANLSDIRVKKSKSEIALSLEGEWKDDLIFVLQDCLDMYKIYKEKVIKVDQMIEQLLENTFVTKTDTELPLPKLRKRKKAHKNVPSFNIRPIAWKIFNVDLYQIEGISHGTVLSLLSKLGEGLHKFPSSKHFVSWLRLAPNNKVSGGKIISSRSPKGRNHLSYSLRQAANSIGNSKDHVLKPFFNRIAFRKGRGAAITATARKLATIIYHMLTDKKEFAPAYHNQEGFERRMKIFSLKKKLSSLNLTQEEKASILV